MTDAGAASRLALFAREDVRDAVRERQAHVLGVLFVLLGGGLAYSAGRTAQMVSAEIELVGRLVGPLALLIPLVALGLVAPAIVEKRATGALTVLLGLPFSRRTVVLGTVLGRTIVIAAGALASLIVAVPIALMMGVSVDPVDLLGVALAFGVLAVTFTAIAVAISTLTRTSTRASFGAFGTYVVFVFGLWAQLPMLALYVVSGFEYPETVPTWVEFVSALNPMTAFTNLGGAVSPLENVAFSSVPTEPAVYERPSAALVILLAWIGVSVWVSILRFERTDL
ncbi:ABC transporter [Natrarchaeobius halalkaliphilus]|uniref:ABC transporter n=1 Tax=Natrarchaeobius halalkaliphilus TaxID=1679091 RepID=A0A3N6P6M6_9EURY|nr:ABC transporter permease subunit [Natrarchaeobius halalkaliphilus]RQG91505.1 ABC transporter [Natrarchaeobius halalkaliphilus]